MHNTALHKKHCAAASSVQLYTAAATTPLLVPAERPMYQFLRGTPLRHH
jgi:hypothetical protein